LGEPLEPPPVSPAREVVCQARFGHFDDQERVGGAWMGSGIVVDPRFEQRDVWLRLTGVVEMDGILNGDDCLLANRIDEPSAQGCHERRMLAVGPGDPMKTRRPRGPWSR